MSTTMDARSIAKRGNDALQPVTTAVYTVQFVMNEDNPVALDANHIAAFTAEIQHALDNGFTTDLRYDAVNFEVVSRIIIATTAPPED